MESVLYSKTIRMLNRMKNNRKVLFLKDYEEKQIKKSSSLLHIDCFNNREFDFKILRLKALEILCVISVVNTFWTTPINEFVSQSVRPSVTPAVSGADEQQNYFNLNINLNYTFQNNFNFVIFEEIWFIL